MKVAVSALQVSRNNSGIGKYIINLVSRLVRDYPADYLVYHSRGIELSTWISGDSLEFRDIQAAKEDFIRRNLFELILFGRDVGKQRADVFFAPDTKLPPGLPRAVKKIVTVHDLAVFKYPETYQKSRVLYWQRLFASSVRQADRVVVISEATKKDVRELLHVPEEKISVIYNGVGEEFQPFRNAQKCAELRRKYHLPEKYILFVGIFSPRKNLSRLMEAYAALIREGKLPHRLVIAGETGWKYQNDLQMAQELGLEELILFPGYIEEQDLPAIYSMADVLAYPSIYEGFGLPILEAMACGTPVVASDVSSIPEVAGNAGLLVNPYSVEDITVGLRRILTDPLLHRQLAAAGTVQAKKFSWDLAAKQMYELILEAGS